MSNSNGRDQKGRFSKGNPGGPGRKKREAEESYLACVAEVCSVDRWRAICERAVQDAEDGDPTARQWLSKHLVGDEPAVSINMLMEPGVKLLEHDDWYGNRDRLKETE